jgi:hypothetical protein
LGFVTAPTVSDYYFTNYWHLTADC